MTGPVGQYLRPEQIHRLLVIKPESLGDSVLLVPALRALRHALPSAQISWLVSDRNREFAQTVPYVDHLIVLKDCRPASLLRAVSEIRHARFDVVIDFEQRSWLSALLGWLSSCSLRYGFYAPGQLRGRLYSDRYWKYFARHEVHEFLGLVAMITPVVFDVTLEAWDSDTGRAEIDKLDLRRTGEGPLVVLHPGCGGDGLPREWPLANYAVLGHWLIQKHGAELVVTAGSDETKKSADLVRLLNGRARDAGGKLSVQGLVALLNRADLLISGNTGVMHLAAALRRPQVALHGPTNPQLRGPLSASARIVSSSCPDCPCLRFGHEYHRRDSACMTRVDVDQVKNAIEDLWQGVLPAVFDKPGDI